MVLFVIFYGLHVEILITPFQGKACPRCGVGPLYHVPPLEGISLLNSNPASPILTRCPHVIDTTTDILLLLMHKHNNNPAITGARLRERAFAPKRKFSLLHLSP